MKIMKIHYGMKPVHQACSTLMIITSMAPTQDHTLIPKLCYLSGASKSDVRILSTSQKKTSFATNSFALILACLPPGRITTQRGPAIFSHFSCNDCCHARRALLALPPTLALLTLALLPLAFLPHVLLSPLLPFLSK